MKDKEQNIMGVISKSNIQLSNKIEDYMEDLKNITKSPILKQHTDDIFLKQLEVYSETNYAGLEFQQNVNQLFHSIFSYKSQIQSVFLFNLSGMNECRIKTGILTEDYNPKNEKWFRQSIENYGKPVIIDSFEFPQTSKFKDKRLFVFSMARGIVRVKSSKVVGVLLVNTGIDYLADLCSKMIVAEGQRILISNSEGKIVYDTMEINIGRDLDFDLWYLVGKAPNQSLRTKVNENTFYISYLTLQDIGWKIINMVPEKELFNQINKMQRITIIITVCIIIISFLIVFIISRQILGPLKKLVLLMKVFQKGDFNVNIKTNRYDEIGVLSRAFNTMASKVKKLIEEVYLDKIKQKELELQLLQN
jgi:two-component system, sensor histidine kinase YesM